MFLKKTLIKEKIHLNPFSVIQFKLSPFPVRGSCFIKRHLPHRGQVGSQKANGIIYSIVEEKNYNLSPLWGFEPQAVSPKKAIPAGWRDSCTPFSACLYSCPEERCSADCPYFGLTLWYLGISSNRFCFYVFNICFLLFLMRAMSR